MIFHLCIYFKQIEDFVKSSSKKILRKCRIQVVKDMKMSFHSCLETNSSVIGIARGAQCPICNVCSNLVHFIDWVNSNIALEALPDSVIPPMAITPLPVGDVTIAGRNNPKGKVGPEI